MTLRVSSCGLRLADPILVGLGLCIMMIVGLVPAELGWPCIVRL